MTWDRMLWTGQFRVQFMAGATACCLLQNVTMDSGAHPGSYSVHTKVLSLGTKWWGCKVNHSPQLVLRLRMPGAIPFFPVCTLTAWPGPTLPLPFTYSLTKSSCLCSDVCLAILIYIYSSHFNAHLPRPLCPVCFEIWSKTRQLISRLTTGLWEKCILSEIYIFIFGTRTIRKQ